MELRVALRPYQQAAIDGILGRFNAGERRALVVLPTGCGKTVVFCSFISEWLRHNPSGRALVLAHRNELIEQAADKYRNITGVTPGIEKGSRHAVPSDRVVVGSVQSLKGKRLQAFPSDAFGIVVIDEVHHALAATYANIMNHFTAHYIGVTATPERNVNGRDIITDTFGGIAYEYTFTQAVADGYLCPLRIERVPVRVDLGGLRPKRGDYSEGDAAAYIVPVLSRIADVIATEYADRKTVVFLPLVATSQQFADMLRERGLPTWEVNGNSADRREVVEAFDAAPRGVLCNAMLLTEGWDCPSVNAVMVLRPTRSRNLYVQMVGRGTRLCEGKTECLLLDVLMQSDAMDIMRPACLVTSDVEDMRTLDSLADSVVTLDDLTGENAERRLREARLVEEIARAQAEDRKRYENVLKGVNRSKCPVTLSRWLHIARMSYVPAAGGTMPESVVNVLVSWGIYPDVAIGSDTVNEVLGMLAKRQRTGYATPKQVNRLHQAGFRDVMRCGAREASAIMGNLSKNNAWGSAARAGYTPWNHIWEEVGNVRQG